MRRIGDRDLIKFIGYIIRIILLLGIFSQMALSAYQILILVLLELYIAVNSYLTGKERSIVNVIDAGISFIVREIILELFSTNSNITDLLMLAGIVGILTFSRFLASR
jgi:uncharacterized membrane protein (DUF373 family)